MQINKLQIEKYKILIKKPNTSNQLIPNASRLVTNTAFNTKNWGS